MHTSLLCVLSNGTHRTTSWFDATVSNDQVRSALLDVLGAAGNDFLASAGRVQVRLERAYLFRGSSMLLLERGHVQMAATNRAGFELLLNEGR